MLRACKCYSSTHARRGEGRDDDKDGGEEVEVEEAHVALNGARKEGMDVR